MKKDSKESINRQIRHYTAKHSKLDEELVFEQRRRIPDTLRIDQIKKLKLMCKDKLEQLNRQLKQLSAPKRPSADIIQLPAHDPIATTVSARLAASG